MARREQIAAANRRRRRADPARAAAYARSWRQRYREVHGSAPPVYDRAPRHRVVVVQSLPRGLRKVTLACRHATVSVIVDQWSYLYEAVEDARALHVRAAPWCLCLSPVIATPVPAMAS